ncbi:MAG: four helix bundle protein [Candidatus Uhrbacteria bacterium]|nr:four helix bundle protein [Candidatus Uhrbacteria bacterium]
MTKVEKYTDLETWKRAHWFTIEIYKMTKLFPKEERFGLTDQSRRSASSIGANIAEGFGRYHFKDKNKFYYQARGSLFEIQNHLHLAKDLSCISQKEFDTLFLESQDLGRLINGLIRSTGIVRPNV